MQSNFIFPYLEHNFSTYLHKNKITDQGKELFQQVIYDYFQKNGRIFAWRQTNNPYYIVVSEIMLQQTQTDRVKEKYELFIQTFPTIESLAVASFEKVISAWQGLGYNRRALALHKFAQAIYHQSSSIIPNDPKLLQTYKGIGPNTASSICAFAFNNPTVFIETNIRAVFIHCFFNHTINIKDSEILPLIEQTLDYDNPCKWYYALMDYGVLLKKIYKNPSKKSAHYTVQSKFEGSDRQIRGLILKVLIKYRSLDADEIIAYCQKDKNRVKKQLEKLINEEFIILQNNSYFLNH